MVNTNLGAGLALWVGGVLAMVAATASNGVAPPLDIPITATVASEIPLQISDMKIARGSGGTLQLAYKLSNLGQYSLVGFQVSWQLRLAQDRYIRTEQHVDHFFEPSQRVGAGAFKIVNYEFPIPVQDSVDPMSVLGKVTFVEFSDGSRVGPEKDALWDWFKLLRNRRAARYRQLLDTYNFGGEAALEKALATATPSELECAREARLWLKEMAGQKGMHEVVVELQRLVAVKVEK